MLGIRRYGGAAIDLFQGEVGRFAVDAVLAPSLAELTQADLQGHRHVSLDICHGEQPAALMLLVKAFLDGARSQPGVRRITLVTPEAAVYTALQDELFRLFPDEAE